MREGALRTTPGGIPESCFGRIVSACSNVLFCCGDCNGQWMHRWTEPQRSVSQSEGISIEVRKFLDLRVEDCAADQNVSRSWSSRLGRNIQNFLNQEIIYDNNIGRNCLEKLQTTLNLFKLLRSNYSGTQI